MPQRNPRSTSSRPSSRPSSNTYRPSGTGRRVQSVRIGDMPSARTTTERTKSPGISMRVRVIIAVIVVLVIGGLVAGVVLKNFGVFPVQQVTVTGVSHLTAQEMTDLAAVPAGTTLFNVDEAGIVGRLKSNAWVDSVSFHRNFPDTLELDITEREIQAVATITSVSTSTTENWALASDGTWLMKIPDQNSAEAASVSANVYEDAQAALHITDVPYGINPTVGGQCTDSSVLNALDIVAALTTDLSESVSTVSAADADSTLLTLNNGIQIAFGTAENVREKERVCLQLMEQYPDKIAYINVSVVSRPTWRALSA